MATLISIYTHPADVTAFDDYYRATHLALEVFP